MTRSPGSVGIAVHHLTTRRTSGGKLLVHFACLTTRQVMNRFFGRRKPQSYNNQTCKPGRRAGAWILWSNP